MIIRASDMIAVSNILNHPKVFKFICDDVSDLIYVPNEQEFYIINDAETGVVRLDKLNGISCMIHMAARPELWGKVKEFSIKALEWGFKNTFYTKVIAIIPEYNKLAISLCMKCNFKQEGMLTKSFLKDFTFYDQHVFGLTKTDFYKGEQLCQ